MFFQINLIVETNFRRQRPSSRCTISHQNIRLSNDDCPKVADTLTLLFSIILIENGRYDTMAEVEIHRSCQIIKNVPKIDEICKNKNFACFALGLFQIFEFYRFP